MTTLEIETVVGKQKVSSCFLYNYRKERVRRGLFPEETCELLVVRGTISFCNNIITILPVGEIFGVECSNVMK